MERGHLLHIFTQLADSNSTTIEISVNRNPEGRYEAVMITYTAPFGKKQELSRKHSDPLADGKVALSKYHWTIKNLQEQGFAVTNETVKYENDNTIDFINASKAQGLSWF